MCPSQRITQGIGFVEQLLVKLCSQLFIITSNKQVIYTVFKLLKLSKLSKQLKLSKYGPNNFIFRFLELFKLLKLSKQLKLSKYGPNNFIFRFLALSFSCSVFEESLTRKIWQSPNTWDPF